MSIALEVYYEIDGGRREEMLNLMSQCPVPALVQFQRRLSFAHNAEARQEVYMDVIHEACKNRTLVGMCGFCGKPMYKAEDLMNYAGQNHCHTACWTGREPIAKG